MDESFVNDASKEFMTITQSTHNTSQLVDVDPTKSPDRPCSFEVSR